VFDPDSPPHNPIIAGALGPVREALGALASRVTGGPRRLLIGCSGGPDSIAALGLLSLLCRSERLELIVGHVDHGLRAESGAEAEHVERVAIALRLACLRTNLELARGSGLPARAREARRSALEQQREACGAVAIVLAHTATDQAETMFMHLCRGAGLDGLAAMPTFEAPWLRPLLGLTRAQTRELCGLLDLPFVDDPSNANTDALRIWLREQVLVRMREENPKLELALLGLASQARDAEQALCGWAQAEVERRTTSDGWSLVDFDLLPRAVRSRMLRRVCELVGVDLGQLRRQVVETMDAAAVTVAVSGRAIGTPNPAPLGFDLHPSCRVEIGKFGLRGIKPTTLRGGPNH
jgi:tRNA(Ile)-lysidine synthase